MNREIIFKIIYREMWLSADFESDFQRDWFAVYQLLQDFREDEIPDAVVVMLAQYLKDYAESLA